MNYNVGPFNPYCVGEKAGSLLNKTRKSQGNLTYTYGGTAFHFNGR